MAGSTSNTRSQEPLSRGRSRRGLATSGLIVIVGACCVVTLGAVVITPRILGARQFGFDGAGQSGSESLDPDLQRLVDGLSLIARSSLATLQVHRAANGVIDLLVIWMDDEIDPGHVNRSEILVLRYSTLLRSLTAFHIERDDHSSGEERLSSARLRDYGLADHLVSQADVIRRVIATNLSGMRLIPVGAPDVAGRTAAPDSPGWIELTWSPESVDTASKVIVPEALPPRMKSR